jgi:Subtilase family
LAKNHARPKIAIRITTPCGDTSPWIGPGQDWYWPAANDVRFWAAYFDIAGERPWLLLAMAPTAEVVTTPRTAPSGNWLVEVANKGGRVAVKGWIQRGDTPFGYPIKGRQSRYDDPAYVRFTLAGRPEQDDFGPSYVRRMGSVNALATGQLPVVIGGFRSSDNTASEYSGAGPVATPVVVPKRTGPDASAIADISPALQGVLAAGTRTRSTVAMSGTSIAAPQITRMIAESMPNAPVLDRTTVEAAARAADPAPPAPASVAEERIGAGRIRLPLRAR